MQSMEQASEGLTLALKTRVDVIRITKTDDRTKMTDVLQIFF